MRPAEAPDRRSTRRASAGGSGSPWLRRRASSLPSSSTGWAGRCSALPPLLMLVGLVQLAYCDLTRRLLPKTLVYALGASGHHERRGRRRSPCPDWKKLVHATLGGLVFFAVFFFINLMNPRWIAYGDVRLSLVVGFGLAWVSPMALLDGFFYANLMAAVVGLVLIGLAPGQAGLGAAVRALPRRGGRTRPGHLELTPRPAEVPVDLVGIAAAERFCVLLDPRAERNGARGRAVGVG